MLFTAQIKNRIMLTRKSERERERRRKMKRVFERTNKQINCNIHQVETNKEGEEIKKKLQIYKFAQNN